MALREIIRYQLLAGIRLVELSQANEEPERSILLLSGVEGFVPIQRAIGLHQALLRQPGFRVIDLSQSGRIVHVELGGDQLGNHLGEIRPMGFHHDLLAQGLVNRDANYSDPQTIPGVRLPPMLWTVAEQHPTSRHIPIDRIEKVSHSNKAANSG